MKRRYKEASAAAAETGFAVLLDGKPLQTPARHPMVLPTRALAEAIAAEWAAQGDEVKPKEMPLTRLAATALDLMPKRRDDAVIEAANYAGTDLVCYRAAHPPELTRRQHAAWQPLLDWATLRFDAPLNVTSGIVPVEQPAASLRAYAAAVAAYDALRLVALHAATTACGSLVIALALVEGRLDAAEAFALSQLDESFQIEQWGEDAEQQARREALRADIAAAHRFLSLLAG